MAASTSFIPQTRRGFTLVELLTVMAIMALLLAVTIPAIEGLNQSGNMNAGAQLFADEVALARQIASARNITVEVRCMQKGPAPRHGYLAIQLWSPATGQPISRVEMLPDGIGISEATQISSLFSSYNASLPTGTMPPPPGSSSGTATVNYVSITISPSGLVGPLTPPTASSTPSGTMVLPNMNALIVGVMTVSHVQDTTLPKNYVLVQLNPLTAATIIYRP